jgi:ribonuclease HII
MILQHSPSHVLEAGTDEAGRGCLAGPVTAAAVILPPDFKNDLLNDSKQLNLKQRNYLRPIIEAEALAWAVVHVGPEEIDEINILQASITGMHRALDELKIRPEFVAVDGNKFRPYGEVPHHCQVKGDATYQNIAAASVLAKTYRDDFMTELAKSYPQYHWDQNAGYPTKSHRDALRSFGPTPHHRMSFQLLPNQLSLFDL